jgi:chemotaxis protein MotB
VAEPAGHELIIVRRHEDEEHEHHSSAWKVAHADFMTAMMAFFLIMWLINVTDEQVRKGISDYFNPIHMSQGSTELKGLNKPDAQAARSRAKKGHSDTPLPDEALNPMKLSSGHADDKTVTEAEAAAAAVSTAAAEGADSEPAAAAADASAAGMSQAPPLAAVAGARPSPATGDSERAAFRDPYAVLAKLAEQYAANHPVSIDVVAGDDGQMGVIGGDVDRDPFDPAYWQLSPAPTARAETPGKPDSLASVPANLRPDAAAAQTKSQTIARTTTEAASRLQSSGSEAQAAPQPDGAEAAERDHSKDDGDPAATAALSEAVAADIARSVKATMTDEASPQLSVAATAEGVIINLTDGAAYSMFPVGSAVPDARTVVLLEEVAKVLASHPGKIVIRGYTDGRPFRSADYDNWRLSAARAHMAYYMLTRGGLYESRVNAIEGHADRSLKNPADPYAAENRRIEILLKEDG